MIIKNIKIPDLKGQLFLDRGYAAIASTKFDTNVTIKVIITEFRNARQKSFELALNTYFSGAKSSLAGHKMTLSLNA